MSADQDGRRLRAVGGAVHVRLGDRVAAVDAWAREQGILTPGGEPNRAAAVRRLIDIALAAEPQV